jgi:hypothetical protein
MSAIDTAMLSAMRSAIADLLPDSCAILSATDTPDGAGGVTQTWGTASTVTCRLDVKNNRQLEIGGGVRSFIETMLSVPYDTTVTEANRVLHGGVTYAVVAPVNSDASWLAVKRVKLERV